MKLIFLLLLCSGAMAQKDTIISLPIQDGKIFYDQVYQDSGKTKDQLFLKAKDVFLRLFPDTKDVIQDADKEDGLVSGKGYFSMPLTLMRMTIRIIVKDNKYKVQIFDFYASSTLLNNDTETPVEKSYTIAMEKPRSKKVCNSWINFNDNVLYVMNVIANEMHKKINTDF